jgi:transcriptional regulator with XRE-family HTH domain
VISPYVRRRRLATELRALREEHGFSAADLARATSLSRQTISRLENAHVRPDLSDIQRILRVYSISQEREESVLTVASDARERGWWEPYRDAMGSRQALYANLEAGACNIREYQMTLLPGLLQIQPFTEARARADRDTYPDTFNPDRAVEARATRQQILYRADGPTYQVIIDELAIRRLAAPPSVVAAQLDHLVEMGHENERVTIQILPLSASIADRTVPRSAFFTYHYPQDPVVVAVDTITSDLVLTDAAQVHQYLRLYSQLEKAALDPLDSLDFLAHASQTLPQDRGTRR